MHNVGWSVCVSKVTGSFERKTKKCLLRLQLAALDGHGLTPKKIQEIFSQVCDLVP